MLFLHGSVSSKNEKLGSIYTLRPVLAVKCFCLVNVMKYFQTLPLKTGEPAQAAVRRDVAVRDPAVAAGRRGQGGGDRAQPVRRGLRQHDARRQPAQGRLQGRPQAQRQT